MTRRKTRARAGRKTSHWTSGRTRPASSTSMCWRCPGRRPIARRRGRATRAAKTACNAAAGPLPSSCTGCGRNTRRAFRHIARCRRRNSTAAQVAGALEMMPSPILVMHEWDRHGTCSGLSSAAYFETMRKARAAVKIPPEYLDLASPISVTPDDVAEAFVKINPGLTRADMAVACDKTRLTEVRLCIAKDFSKSPPRIFRSTPAPTLRGAVARAPSSPCRPFAARVPRLINVMRRACGGMSPDSAIALSRR